MERCLATCLHYQFVQQYRLERQRLELERDTAVGAYGPGSEEWRDYGPLITFKQWLINMRGWNEDQQVVSY